MQIKFRTIELRSPRRVKMKVVPELPEGYESLSNFVATEVESFAEQVREVLDGDSNGFSGNRYELVFDGKTVYISDTANGAVRRIRGNTVETLAIRSSSALRSYPVSPRGLCVMDNKLYVCDNFSKKIFIISL